ncbi:MAG: hypothetical protein LZ169_06175 [Thaumarchaeota archaeon]|nr:hypothetical protein [Candidatus Wolframiiraptor allenii]
MDGVKEFRNIAMINVEDADSLLFKPIDVKTDGLSSISLSGRVLLVSDNNSYTIDMPCILRLNVSCPRITAIIPGYDAPLRIEPGRYLLFNRALLERGQGPWHDLPITLPKSL